MKYRIKPEFFDLWGSETTEDTVISESDLEMITRGWEKKPEDVMDQLIPLEETLYTAVIESDNGIHLLRKNIYDHTAQYEDFECAMQNKAEELHGELHCIYCPDDIVEDVTIE